VCSRRGSGLIRLRVLGGRGLRLRLRLFWGIFRKAIGRMRGLPWCLFLVVGGVLEMRVFRL